MTFEEADQRRQAAYALAWSHYRQVDAAITELDTVIAAFPNFARAISDRGVAYWLRHDFAQALVDHDKALTLEVGDGELWHRRGVVFEDMGPEHWDRAISEFTTAVSLPNKLLTQAYNSRAVVHGMRCEWTEAVEDWERAIAADPAFYKPYVNLAAYYRERDVKRGEAYLRRAIEVAPDEADVYAEQARFCSKLGDMKGAWQAINRAIEVGPDDPAARNDRAAMHLAEGRADAALADLDAVSEVPQARDDIDVQQNRAAALVALGRYDEALSAVGAALQLAPNNAELWGVRAAVYFEMKDWKQSRQAMDRALALAPKDPDLLENDALLRAVERGQS